MPCKIVANDILIFFIIFSEKIRLDILYELSANIKCQALFSLKTNCKKIDIIIKTKFQNISPAVVIGTLRVKFCDLG